MNSWLVFRYLTVFIILSMPLWTSAAQTSPSAYESNADGIARIVERISITKITDLSFGDIIATDKSGTVVVDVSGTRAKTGGAELANVGGVAATFLVRGEPAYAYTTSLLEINTVTISNGSTSMLVDQFINDATGILGPSGDETVRVGATLHVNSFQPAGLYEGNFEVTVAYN